MTAAARLLPLLLLLLPLLLLSFLLLLLPLLLSLLLLLCLPLLLTLLLPSVCIICECLEEVEQ